MDDVTVMDGVCEQIIKQGKLSKRKPQMNSSSISVFANHIRLKSDRLFATFPLIMNTHQFPINSQMLNRLTLLTMLPRREKQ